MALFSYLEIEVRVCIFMALDEVYLLHFHGTKGDDWMHDVAFCVCQRF